MTRTATEHLKVVIENALYCGLTEAQILRIAKGPGNDA